MTINSRPIDRWHAPGYSPLRTLLLQSVILMIAALLAADNLLAETGSGSDASVNVALPPSGKSAIAIPSLPQPDGKKDLIVNGKIEIRRGGVRGGDPFPPPSPTHQHFNN